MKVLLLTLPGAALWSLPIGLWLVNRFGPSAAGNAFIFPNLSNLLGVTGLVAFVLALALLIPVSAGCSIHAVKICNGSSRIGFSGGVLHAFNLISAALSLTATLVEALYLILLAGSSL